MKPMTQVTPEADMADTDQIEWPREIWMAEREDHDQGVVNAVLSEHATIARWEGDTERDREFHHYIDADIHKSAERYYEAKIEEMRARIKADRIEELEAQVEAANAVIAAERGEVLALRDKLAKIEVLALKIHTKLTGGKDE
jgi:hypothetical protein